MKIEIECFQPLETFKSGDFTTVYQGVAQPHQLVKEIDYLYMHDGDKSATYSFEEFHSHVVSTARKFLFDSDLRTFIPATRFAWGRNTNGQQRGFMIMEKVTGTPLAKCHLLAPEVAASTDRLIAAALGMSNESVSKSLPDILDAKGTFSNIIVGILGEDPEQKPYLVDIYPAETLYNFTSDEWQKALGRLSQRHAYDFALAGAAIEAAFA